SREPEAFPQALPAWRASRGKARAALDDGRTAPPPASPRPASASTAARASDVVGAWTPPDHGSIKGGAATSACYDACRASAVTLPTTIDLTPPPLEVAAATPYILPGGAGLVVVRAGDAVRADAKVGSLSFPTFPMGPQGTRVGFFALPYDIPSGTSLSVTAADEAGNAVTRGIPAEMLPRRFRRDTIEVSDAFLNAKVPELLP